MSVHIWCDIKAVDVFFFKEFALLIYNCFMVSIATVTETCVGSFRKRCDTYG